MNKTKRVKLSMLIISLLLILTAPIASAMTVTYTELGVPDINSSFKSYEDYGCITSSGSAQYKFLNDWCYVDAEGFVRCGGETDLGIPEDYYCVAMGSYYATAIGSKFRVTTDTGRVFYCALTDQKANCDTNPTHQWGTDCHDVIEFVVNSYLYRVKENGKPNKQWLPNNETYLLNPMVRQHGSANVFMPLNGKIAKIERINFLE